MKKLTGVMIVLSCGGFLAACDNLDYTRDYYSSGGSNTGYVSTYSSNVDTSRYNRASSGGYSSSGSSMPSSGGYSSSR